MGAVEDPALLDVALGGPDTSQRLRIVQRVVRQETAQTSCITALGDLEQTWAKMGLQFDPTTMRLNSAASLQVSFQKPTTQPTPCEPVAQGGYLGAENQLIRVQIASVDANGVPTLVWGFDNAYFLYRISQPPNVDKAGGTTTLTLASAPVDAYHQPAKNQAVEALEAAAQLTAADYIAATTGIVTTVASDYEPDGQVVISTALGAPTTGSPLLFLRVWQDTIVLQGAGPFALGDTGVQVTLSSSTGVYHVGDYWLFAVRPGTPTEASPVYPERILEQAQPPEGPRLWACPLALVEWAAGVPAVTDCRQHFWNLVELSGQEASGCCDARVRPQDLSGGITLQSVVDSFEGRQATICLAPGPYTLDSPLRLGPQHSGLTIEACSGAALLTAAENAAAAFGDGLVVIDGADEITLRGLRFALPQVPMADVKLNVPPKLLTNLTQKLLTKLFFSFGVRAVQCRRLTIEECLFELTAKPTQEIMAAGVFASGECRDLTIRGCWFASQSLLTRRASHMRLLIGFLHAPSAKLNVDGGGTVTPALLEDAVFSDNHFSGLTVASFVYASCGAVALANNTVRFTEIGFLFFSLGSLAYVMLRAQLTDEIREGLQTYAKALFAVLQRLSVDPALLATVVLAESYPLPTQPAHARPIVHPLPPLPRPILSGLQAIEVKPRDPTEVPAATHPVSLTLERADALFGGPGAKPPKPAKLTRSGSSVGMTAKAAAPLHDITLAIAELERAALLKAGGPLGLSLALLASGNDVDLRSLTAPGAAGVVGGGAALGPGVFSGPALFVWDVPQQTQSAVSLTGNRMATQSGGLGVAVALLTDRSAVSGNVLENATSDGNSLIVVPGPATAGAMTATRGVAATGNVFGGVPLLPPTGQAAPLDHWNVFDSVV